MATLPTTIGGETDPADASTVPPARWPRRLVPWLPALVSLAATIATLRVYGVSPAELTAYGVYLALGVTLPGTLLYRLATRHRRTLAEDLAAGTAIGLAAEVIVYIGVRSIGAPLLVLAWPALVLTAFVVRPALRSHWYPRQRLERAPVWWSWTLAVLFGVILYYSAASFFAMSGVTVPTYANADFDMPFHLALIGELKHHAPPQIPYVLGEPLYYHWFTHADIAATSWVTGIEPLTLLRRLTLLPGLAVTVVAIACLARRLTGTWWTGPVAVAVTFVVLAPNPYHWQFQGWPTDFGFGVVDDGSLLRTSLWLSPSQTFAAGLFAGLVLVLLRLLDGEVSAAAWPVFGVLLLAVMGSKATFVPLLAAGLLAVVGLALIRRRGRVVALTALGLTGLCLLFAQFILFGGSTQGLRWRAFGSLDAYGIGAATGLTTVDDPGPFIAELIVITLVGLALVWAGAFALRRRDLARSDIVLLLGIGLAGIGATYGTVQDGLSQTLFLQSARPYLSLAAVCGLWAAVARAPRSGRVGWWLFAAAVAGGGLLYEIRLHGYPIAPVYVPAGGSRWWAVEDLAKPYLFLLVGLGGGALVVWLLRSRLGTRGLVVPIVLAAMLGAGVDTAVEDRLVPAAQSPPTRGWTPNAVPSVSAGGLEAGRWLRDHSSPDDIVATNVHCAPVPAGVGCLNGHYWVSGFTERRVLVEGWGYTARTNDTGQRLHIASALVPFHDPDRLWANDNAFTAPSPASLSVLRERYGVRWLFVDRSERAPADGLATVATLRFASGTCEVYELG